MTLDRRIEELQRRRQDLLEAAAKELANKGGSWGYAYGCAHQVDVIERVITGLSGPAPTERLRAATPALLAACEAAHADLKREIASLESALYRHEPDATGAMIPVPGTAGDEGETELNGMRTLLAQLADAITQAKGTAP